MNKVRVAIFADPHIRNRKMQSQTDFGAPSRWLPRKALQALNSIQPDYIFGLGDLTATGHKKDWQGYKKWLGKLNAPVFDILGNHDRDYTVFQSHNYGKGYFNVLGRVSATKAIRIGNIIFILVSEEHDPEGNKKLLTSTVPTRTFEFIENILEKYSKDNNIFVLSHTLLRGTTALSNDWSFNDINAWAIISRKFFNLFKEYSVVGHMTGHAHIDYRYRAKLKDIGKRKYKRKVGKFINGADFRNLPNTYFLNMPCVDTAHGWVGSNFALFRKLGKATAKSKRSPFRWLYIQLEEKGLPIFDILYTSKIHCILGRPAVYYFDINPGDESIEIITRWVGKNKDTEKYNVSLTNKVKLPNPKAEIIAADLSLRNKDNLQITQNSWFEVPAREIGGGIFSQRFPKKRKIKNARIKAENLKSFDLTWQGSKNKGQTWNNNWENNPTNLGKINAVKLQAKFKAGEKPLKVQDIYLE
ncbi:MAG: metallophosphoesterase family protein [Patescibacteria group bacterium]